MLKLVAPNKEFNWYKSWVSRQRVKYSLTEEDSLPPEKRHPLFYCHAMMSRDEFKSLGFFARRKQSFLHLPPKEKKTYLGGLERGSIKSNKNLMEHWRKLIRNYECSVLCPKSI